MNKIRNNHQKEEAEYKKQIKILKALKDEELDNADLLKDRVIRKNICIVTECTMKELSELINSFSYFESLHRWLKVAEANGEPMPKSIEEFMERFKANPTKTNELFSKRNRKIKHSKKQKIQFLKWGQNYFLK